MKKVLCVVACCLIVVCGFVPAVFAQTTTESTTEATESTTLQQTTQQAAQQTTEFVLKVDVNKRYTDISEAPEDGTTNEKGEGGKTVYIALLCAALVVAVVILAVTLKRVPKEEDIDISGKGSIKKKKEE